MLEAKNSLSRLVAAAERGEEVVLARDGKPVAKIVRFELPKVKPPGSWKGKVELSPDWDSPETNELIAEMFYASARRDF
jgi:antitoxin (DNA-binding transcriptional repressor) of toxin-antitoxin stability system